ncbi:unnamed protein product [Eruca vesicaria subsp. sativa]|uniref:MPN domain-containing protein n=1 Tax=Eruca vesicaria subsp. sativa TaxID=29727 RepID=A0ABC8IQN2_ERUVS|nr:unnamed protein product [Eruca vesicaria subsp. sativa]
MTTQEMSARTIEKVVVHPLVLRNINDNHNRMGTQITRTIGVLLGTISRMPFEEDIHGPIDAWRIDENHLQSMFRMYKGLNDKEHVLGWYSAGPTRPTSLRERDLHIHANILRDYVPNPLWVVIDVPRVQPLEAYYSSSNEDDFVRVSTVIATPPPPISGPSVLVTQMTPGGENGRVDFLERYYTHVKNSVRISVSGYDTSLDVVELVGYLEKHFESCGLKDIRVPTHPVTGAIISSSATVVLRGEGVADKALALNGSYVGGWKLSVTILPPVLDVMSTDMTAREFALGYAAAENPF